MYHDRKFDSYRHERNWPVALVFMGMIGLLVAFAYIFHAAVDVIDWNETARLLTMWSRR
ncbi:MAG: hypothetical protein WAZ27_05015 [Minisyncoccia bacterium]